jgi:hypothetical protein
MFLPLLLYPVGWCYEEDNWVSYNIILNMTLSLLIYIYIYRYNYLCLRNTSWCSKISWIMGRVVMDPYLGLLSPYDVVTRVLILIHILDKLKVEQVKNNSRTWTFFPAFQFVCHFCVASILVAKQHNTFKCWYVSATKSLIKIHACMNINHNNLWAVKLCRSFVIW